MKRGCFWETRPVQVHVVSQQRFLSVSDAANSARVNVRLMKYHPVSPERCFLQHRCKIAESTLLIRGFGSQLLFEIKARGAHSFSKILSVGDLCSKTVGLWSVEPQSVRVHTMLLDCLALFTSTLAVSQFSLFFLRPRPFGTESQWLVVEIYPHRHPSRI